MVWAVLRDAGDAVLEAAIDDFLGQLEDLALDIVIQTRIATRYREQQDGRCQVEQQPGVVAVPDQVDGLSMALREGQRRTEK